MNLGLLGESPVFDPFIHHDLPICTLSLFILTSPVCSLCMSACVCVFDVLMFDGHHEDHQEDIIKED